MSIFIPVNGPKLLQFPKQRKKSWNFAILKEELEKQSPNSGPFWKYSCLISQFLLIFYSVNYTVFFKVNDIKRDTLNTKVLACMSYSFVLCPSDPLLIPVR